MQLGSLRYATNDVRIFAIYYGEWLAQGYVLSTVTVTIPTANIVSTVDSPAVQSPDSLTAYIKITCGDVKESFTLDVVATDTLGQIVHDTVDVTVVDPGAP